MNVGEILLNLWNDSGFNAIISGFLAENGWQSLVMLALACVMFYLGIVLKFEPLLMIGLATGCLLLGGLIFSLRCYRRSRPVFGALLWTGILSCVLLAATFFVPDIRLWELLYL